MPSSSIRNDSSGRAFCAVPRRNHEGPPCDTMLARIKGSTLIIRCRSCKQDHQFRIVGGRIVPAPANGVIAVRMG